MSLSSILPRRARRSGEKPKAAGSAVGSASDASAKTEVQARPMLKAIVRIPSFTRMVMLPLHPAIAATLWLAADETGRIGRIAVALVPPNLWIGADRTPPQRLIAGWRRLGGDQFGRGLTLLDPLFERGQRVDAGIGDAGSIGLDSAMIHAGHHEKA